MNKDDVLQGDLKNIYDNVMNTPTGNKTTPNTSPQEAKKTETLPDSPPPVTKDPEPLTEKISPPQTATPTSFAFSGKAQNPVKTESPKIPDQKNKTATQPPQTQSQVNVTKEATSITKNSSRAPLIICIIFAVLIIWGILWAVILGII